MFMLTSGVIQTYYKFDKSVFQVWCKPFSSVTQTFVKHNCNSDNTLRSCIFSLA